MEKKTSRWTLLGFILITCPNLCMQLLLAAKRELAEVTVLCYKTTSLGYETVAAQDGEGQVSMSSGIIPC